MLRGRLLSSSAHHHREKCSSHEGHVAVRSHIVDAVPRRALLVRLPQARQQHDANEQAVRHAPKTQRLHEQEGRALQENRQKVRLHRRKEAGEREELQVRGAGSKKRSIVMS